MIGGQKIKKYQQILRHNLSVKERFDNSYAQQTPTSTYFHTDKSTRDSE